MPRAEAADTFVTVRDFLRYAVSRMREAGVVHGHGAGTAIDEAAFIVLEALHLPVDDINPWLDARLMPGERSRILSLIEARVETRKPAAYLLNKTYIQSIPFYIDERAIIPRSYLGELLLTGLVGDAPECLIREPGNIARVLDLCTGSGCLAVIAASLFPNARVDAVDLSPGALEVARINVGRHGMSDRIELAAGDLFAPVDGRLYDLIICNPPYVAETEVAAFPPEYAHEPLMAHLGGKDGLDIVRRVLDEAPRHLNPGGALLCEIGTGRDILEAEYPDADFLWLDTEESTGEVFWLAQRTLE
jgi:ribosomal protein L3 glutamine methyltransferase